MARDRRDAQPGLLAGSLATWRRVASGTSTTPQHEPRETDRKPRPNRGNAGKGRPEGSRNRTASAAGAIIDAPVVRLGGADRLLAWVRESPENERVFRSNISPRLLPLQVTGKDEEPFKVSSHILIVPAKEPDDTVVRPLRPAQATPGDAALD